MPVTRCMNRVLEIATTPRETWKAQITTLPAACPNVDCSPGVNCRGIAADYLRVEWGRQIAFDKARGSRRATS